MGAIPLPHAQLAKLSACTTARPGLGQLDEPVHLAAAALMAGYRHVIATLWPLRDDAEPADLIYGDLTRAPAPRLDRGHRGRATTIYRWANHTHHGP